MTSSKNKQVGQPRENPTNVRNGKELIEAAIEALENDRCRTAMIQPQRQPFFMDCRTRSFRDIQSQLDILISDHRLRGTWLSRGPQTNRGFPLQYSTFVPSPPPSPQASSRFSITPDAARILNRTLGKKSGDVSRETERLEKGPEDQLVYIMLFEGVEGLGRRKFLYAYSPGEAASVAFHHLSNGYSVILAGISLMKATNESSGFQDVRRWNPCKSIPELEVVTKQWEGEYRGPEYTIGIIH